MSDGHAGNIRATRFLNGCCYLVHDSGYFCRSRAKHEFASESASNLECVDVNMMDR